MAASVTKKLRFEVFKRDKFTCQYCGRSAPEVILECDHIHPKSKGGANTILNLITACRECNSGKRARLLSDDTVVRKQIDQLKELEERRQQVEMLVAWQKELAVSENHTLDCLCDLFEQLVGGIRLNDKGRAKIRIAVDKFPVAIITDAMRRVVSRYVTVTDGKPDPEGVVEALKALPKFCGVIQDSATDPYLKDALYLRAVAKKACYKYYDSDSGDLLQAIKKALGAGLDKWDIKRVILDARYSHEAVDAVRRMLPHG